MNKTTLKEFIGDMLKGGEASELLDANSFIILARNEKKSMCKTNTTPEDMADLLNVCIGSAIEQMIKDDKLDLANTLACAVTNRSFNALKNLLPEDCGIKHTLAHTVNTADAERMLAPSFMLITEDIFGNSVCEIHNMSTTEMFAGFFATIEDMVDNNQVPKEEVIRILNLALERFSKK